MTQTPSKTWCMGQIHYTRVSLLCITGSERQIGPRGTNVTRRKTGQGNGETEVRVNEG